MATFSTNQVRQLYVANALETPHVTESDAVGSIAVMTDKDKSHLYFEYMSAGGMTRSDLIEMKNIISASVTRAEDLATPLSSYKLTLDSTINEGNPVAGQDYILRIAFRNYIGLSEEDQYFKYGMVHTYAGMIASDFYKALALSLVKNFSREEEGLLKFYLETGGTNAGTVAGTPTEVTKDTKESTLTGTYTGIVIEEAPQEWILGVMEQTPVNFTLQPGTITVSGDDRIWGIVKQVASTSSIPDGHKIADLEYFCMGERGDMYRMMGFPHVIRTKYLVDPEKEYDVIDIHYSYVGSNESVQKSEKDITIVVPTTGGNHDLTTQIETKIKDALSVTSVNGGGGGGPK